MRLRRAPLATASICLLCLTLCGAASADTLNPGSTLTITFAAIPNQSDLLIFGSGEFFTATGSAVVTTELFNGNSLLGRVTSPVLEFSSQQYFTAYFKKAGSQYTFDSPTEVDFSSINDGTIAGKLVVTVAGGSLNYQTNFYFQDGESCSSDCYTPKYNVGITGISPPVAVVPEPTSAPLGGIAIVALFLLRRKAPKKL